MSLDNQYFLQFDVKPVLGLIIGLLQLATLISILIRYYSVKSLDAKHKHSIISRMKTRERYDPPVSSSMTRYLEGESSVGRSGFREDRLSKIIRDEKKDLRNNEQSKKVCDLLYIGMN